MVRIDSDRYFFIVDRKKDLIKVSGFQVWPNEIEMVLNSHEGVVECAVGGIPNLEHGEKVIAWVVLEPDAMVDSSTLRRHCKNSLAAYKIPAEILFIDNIPRTGVGKILRRELISQFKG